MVAEAQRKIVKVRAADEFLPNCHPRRKILYNLLLVPVPHLRCKIGNPVHEIAFCHDQDKDGSNKSHTSKQSPFPVFFHLNNFLHAKRFLPAKLRMTA